MKDGLRAVSSGDEGPALWFHFPGDPGSGEIVAAD